MEGGPPFQRRRSQGKMAGLVIHPRAIPGKNAGQTRFQARGVEKRAAAMKRIGSIFSFS
jgi:hypothetical protein